MEGHVITSPPRPPWLPLNSRCVPVRWTIVLLLPAAAIGCGKSEMAAVSGRVTFNQAAVPDAVVRFIPSGHPEAFGRTDGEGVYRLTTVRKGDGCFLGEARVVIVPWVEGFEPRADDAVTGRKPPPVKPRPDIPRRYRQAASSPLTVTITPDGENIHDFELAD
jgi:hypothetical protein